jgi:MFS family permease
METGGWADLWRGGLLAQFALLLLGVWLNAADTLVTVTVMPSVARQIGGYAYFGWATGAFLLGAITAGASSGAVAKRFGLRRAMTTAGLAYAVGCLLSGLAPGIFSFLIGRLAQGVGAGWIVGLVFVAVGAVFPERLWARVFAATTGVWGVAVVIGPLVGGLFAGGGAGAWRGAFDFFAVQGAVFCVAAALLLPRAAKGEADHPLPWRQLVVLAFGVLAVASAGLMRERILAIALTASGLLLLSLMLRMDARMREPMLPRAAHRIGGAAAAGYAAIFFLECALTGWTVYGAAFVQALYGASPLVSGYVVSGVAIGWTLAAMTIAGLHERWHGLFIRVGAGCILAGLAVLALVIGRGPLPALAAATGSMGAGFGLSWAFLNRRLLANLPEADRGKGSSAVPTVQMIGSAVGAAAASALGDSLGLSQGLDKSAALRAASLMVAAFIPLAVAGWCAADRFARLTEQRLYTDRSKLSA